MRIVLKLMQAALVAVVIACFVPLAVLVLLASIAHTFAIYVTREIKKDGTAKPEQQNDDKNSYSASRVMCELNEMCSTDYDYPDC